MSFLLSETDVFGTTTANTMHEDVPLSKEYGQVKEKASTSGTQDNESSDEMDIMSNWSMSQGQAQG